MSCRFAVSIVFLLKFVAIPVCCDQQVSLSLLSLASWQLSFLDEICKDREENSTTFDDLRDTLRQCEVSMLNGTNISEISYIAISNGSVDEFREIYVS